MNFYLFAYFLGSIPFGLILSKIFLGFDVRSIGSGNIGATNVLRSGHKGCAFLTLVLDLLKGWFPVWCATSHKGIVGLCAVLGHIFPVWLRFKGGKGVATALGGYLALKPWVGLSLLGVWLLIGMGYKRSSLASLITLGSGAFIGHILQEPLFGDAVALLALWTHRENLKRLYEGTESYIDKGSKI